MFRIRHELKLSFETPLRVAVSVVEPLAPTGVVAVVRASFGGGLVCISKGPNMAYVLPDGMQCHVAISYVDAEGNPAQVDGAIHWESSNTECADVFVASDAETTTATIRAKTLGTTQISARADADLGDGVKEIVTTMDIEVVAGEAVAGSISPTGAPEPIPVVDHRT
jgi:hypothetical protein